MADVTVGPGQRLQDAIDSAPPGSTFRLAAGVWRNQAFLARGGDQFIGDANGGTIFSGAVVLDQWRKDGRTWRSSQLPPEIMDSQPGVVVVDPLAMHVQDLFRDDARLKRVATVGEVVAGCWCYANSSAWVGDDPNGAAMEYATTQNMTYNNGATGVLWQNITVERYCSNAQCGAHHGCAGWHYDNATFRQMHGAGLNLGPDCVVSGGRYVDNGQVGITGYMSNNARIENAEIARNGFIGYGTDWDGGGLKIATADRVTLRGNHVHHNKDQGLWADIDCTNWVFEDNTCEDNEGVGIMYEISYGGTRIANNHAARNGGTGGYGAGGIYVSNSMGVEVTGNSIEVKPGNAGIGGGIAVLNQERGAGNQGVYEARDVNVHHNVITHSDDTAQDGYWVYKAINSPAVAFDYNIYHVLDPAARHWRYIDRDVTWTELQATGQERNGTLQGLDEPPKPEPPPTSTIHITIVDGRVVTVAGAGEVIIE